MSITVDAEMLKSLFMLPQANGVYTPDLQSYFQTLSQKRSVALFAFPPKCGGTFLRTAAMAASGGQLYRASYIQGGGEMQFYLPTFVAYFCSPDMPQMVAHIHIQAREGCRNFIRLMGIKPVMMLRNIPDMLVSQREMFLNEDGMMAESIMCMVPEYFPEMSDAEQADFLVYMAAPWYFSYFASWLDFASLEPDRVLLLRFQDLRTQPVETLMRALEHFGLSCPKARCEAAIDLVWQRKQDYRFNKGVAGRGHDFFSPAQFAMLGKMLAQYPVLESYRDELLG